MKRGGVFRGKIRLLAVWLIGPVYSNITKPILLLRMLIKKFFTPKVLDLMRSSSTTHGLDRCRIFYINLASRPDRKLEIEEEFRRLRVRDFERFDAIAREKGFVGCGLSHAAVLSGENYPEELVMVCEDDAQFLVSREEIDRIIESFVSQSWLDVLCLGIRVENKTIRIDQDFAISNNIQTASCYVVRRKNRALISSIFAKSAQKLERGWPAWLFAIDIAWKSAQRWRLVFAVPNNTAVVQRQSFSDIEKREVDYYAGEV